LWPPLGEGFGVGGADWARPCPKRGEAVPIRGGATARGAAV